MGKLKVMVAVRLAPTVLALALSLLALALSLCFVCGGEEAKVKPVCNVAMADGVCAEASPIAMGCAERRGSDAKGGMLGQKLIRRGRASLEVRDIAAAGQEIDAWAKRFGGYVESSSSEASSGSVTARIPSGGFERAMEEIGKVGTVKSQSVDVEDATERFYDLETRLGTKRVMRDRLTNYLAQAKSVKDMLNVERELNEVISDIESMEGRMKRLSAEIDRSEIKVDYRLPYRADPRGGRFEWPDFGDSARRFAGNVVDFLMRALEFALYAVVCGVPVLAVLALAYWLLFGRVGLLKRLFRRLR